MDNEPIIHISNVKKSFFLPHEKHDTFIEYATKPWKIFKKAGEQYEVLKDIDLKIYPGEFVGIMGRNGSGKSTLLKIMAGIYEPTSGKVKIRGNMVPFLELGVGFNFELTGRENVYLNGIILGMKKNLLEKKYEEIVEFAELGKFMDVPMKNFSSGMQVRLAFSIAITRAACSLATLWSRQVYTCRCSHCCASAAIIRSSAGSMISGGSPFPTNIPGSNGSSRRTLVSCVKVLTNRLLAIHASSYRPARNPSIAKRESAAVSLDVGCAATAKGDMQGASSAFSAAKPLCPA